MPYSVYIIETFLSNFAVLQFANDSHFILGICMVDGGCRVAGSCWVAGIGSVTGAVMAGVR